MNYLEEVTDKRHHGWFVDLFVKPSNNIAVGFYRKIGYEVYRTVSGYYSDSNGKGGEDAYDMRKSMPKDVNGITSKPLNKSILPSELEYH